MSSIFEAVVPRFFQTTSHAGFIAFVCAVVLIPFFLAIRFAGGPVLVYHPHKGIGADAPVSLQHGTSPALAIGGPYQRLHRGTYLATFEIEQGSQNVAGPTVRLEILLYGPAGVTLFKRDVISQPSSKRSLDLAFTVSESSTVETRVFHYGTADLKIGQITVHAATLDCSSRVFAVAMSIAVIGLVLITLAWIVFPAIRQPRTLPIFSLFCTMCFGALVFWVIPPVSELPLSPPLLAYDLWIPLLLLGGCGVQVALNDPARITSRIIFAGGIACAALLVIALGAISQSFNWYSLAAVVVGFWLSQLCLATIALTFVPRPGRAVLVAAYAFIGLFFFYEQYPFSGDQGSYLVTAAAIAHHGTVNVAPVISSGELNDMAPYASSEALMTDSLTVAGVRGYPARDLGLPIFSIPGYLAGALQGARLQMELVAILLSFIIFVLVQRVGACPGAAVLAWAATCFSFPILHYSSMLYPELCGGTLTAVAALLLVQRSSSTIRRTLLIGMCAALLPWFSARYWALTASIVLLSALRWRHDQMLKHAIALLAPIAVCVVLAVVVNAVIYHLPIPNAGYFMVLRGDNPAIYVGSGTGPFSASFYNGWIGLWFDRYLGLISVAPVFSLLPAGLLFLWKRERSLAIDLLVIGVPYFVAVASTRHWDGGTGAPPRYLVPLIPLMAVPLAAALDACFASRVRAIPICLACLGGIVSAASLISLDTLYDGTRLLAYCREAFGLTFATWLPSMFSSPPGERLALRVLLCLLSTCVVIPVFLHWKVKQVQAESGEAAVTQHFLPKSGR